MQQLVIVVSIAFIMLLRIGIAQTPQSRKAIRITQQHKFASLNNAVPVLLFDKDFRKDQLSFDIFRECFKTGLDAL